MRPGWLGLLASCTVGVMSVPGQPQTKPRLGAAGSPHTAAITPKIRIACVGDSITWGDMSSSRTHAYPEQLQALLDEAHGAGRYAVVNLGEDRAALRRHAQSSYWKRKSFETLNSSTWDVVAIMLGTTSMCALSLIFILTGLNLRVPC